MYQVGSMRWFSILSKYPIITFNNFFYNRKQLLTQMSAIVFFVNFHVVFFVFFIAIVICKKRFGYTIPWNYSHKSDRSTDWQGLQDLNLFHLAKPFFQSNECYFKIFLYGSQRRSLFCFASLDSFVVFSSTWSA